MKRIWISSTVVGALLASLVPATLNAQQRGNAPVAAPANTNRPAEPAPKLADGHPDLSGVWWTGGDVGGRAITARAPEGAAGRRRRHLPACITPGRRKQPRN